MMYVLCMCYAQSPLSFYCSISYFLYMKKLEILTYFYLLLYKQTSPLGFIENGPYGSPEENFRHYRSVEVKHGRIAMAATLGMLVQETSRFQGYLSPSANLKFEDVPNGLGALDVVPLEGWVQMAVVIGLHEVFIKERPGRAPGDFGTGKYFFFQVLSLLGCCFWKNFLLILH